MTPANGPLTPELCRTFVAIERDSDSLTAAARQFDDDQICRARRRP